MNTVTAQQRSGIRRTEIGIDDIEICQCDRSVRVLFFLCDGEIHGDIRFSAAIMPTHDMDRHRTRISGIFHFFTSDSVLLCIIAHIPKKEKRKNVDFVYLFSRGFGAFVRE